MDWIVALSLAGASLSGCVTATAPVETRDPAGLSGITASVSQGRVDVSSGRIFVLVTNGRDEPITVASVEVHSPGFEPGMAKQKPTAFPAGRAIAIRLAPTAAICDEPVDPITVRLDVTTPDGAVHDEVAADDPYGSLERIHDQACLGESVAAVAALTLPDHLRSTGSGAERRAVIDIAVAPVGAPADGAAASFHVSGVRGTTLINAEGGFNWDLDLTIAASDPPSTIELPVRPGRCDAHAVAEDKIGTILPFEIETSDGRSGQLGLPANDTLRAELYAYYSERCGLPGSG
ncbi:hypothetical protein ET445_09740 [Agromyces protaetiae]|uniref:Uncharacterized protein n=1 Tax=Agromyces protaetiae TaxID=2509455 RepID=A0A4P6FGJ8_9MICO|nr:hypothetical protein [Agromyces protaetiae]QAY73579.1 hypothetical protein ET445_09740 [Agromyces protaetiae]